MDTVQVNIHEAKTQLSKLIQAALNGKQVIKNSKQTDAMPGGIVSRNSA